MGLARADWHYEVAGMTVDRSDPFDAAAVDRLQHPDPFVRLRELVLLEADMDHLGVTCPLKDRDWSHPSCSSCPERGDAARAELCRIGMEQEKVLARL